jgi:hypothetical protein
VESKHYVINATSEIAVIWSMWTAVDGSKSFRELDTFQKNNGKVQREFGNSREFLNVSDG